MRMTRLVLPERTMALLTRHDSALIVIDLQERLLAEIPRAEAIVASTVRLIRVADALGVPILWTEQYPKGLGATRPEVKEALGERAPIEKLSFGCMGDGGFSSALMQRGVKQMVLVGAESHVCVLQTALGATSRNLGVFVVADAVASREEAHHEAALSRMAWNGVDIVTSEMVIFEWLGKAGTPEFKAVLPIIKGASGQR